MSETLLLFDRLRQPVEPAALVNGGASDLKQKAAALWNAVDHPSYAYCSPFAPDCDLDLLRAHLLDFPAYNAFSRRVDAVGQSHKHSQLPAYMHYVDNVLEVWADYFGQRSSSDYKQWMQYKAAHPELWAFGQETDAAKPPLKKRRPPPPFQKALQADAAHRKAFAPCLLRRLLFALLITHPDEWLDKAPLSIRELPSEWMLQVVAKKVSAVQTPWEEVRKLCDGPKLVYNWLNSPF